MKIAVVVYGSPTGSGAAASAYRYVSAALELGHEITRVFFYGEAVHTATALAAPPQDENDLLSRWQQLGQARELDLVVCIAAALRRGVLDADEARRHEKEACNLAPGFTLSGLGQLTDATLNSDRVITFGG
ncbi:sulfurtransferase complex subunit TusD [Motiliproteus sp. SC1-56]|uniref:sulfurtransferase complex subunit TusD n=1 Tax=Motiliproteus sp. SC1-56 TaxID=2799565 RepID=UPI001A8E9F1B|nr:sulfurtransferase complex subunit TusD [Motiliproteus sp. SC1-56]